MVNINVYYSLIKMISKKMFYSTKNEKTARVPIISALTVVFTSDANVLCGIWAVLKRAVGGA